ncbi:hypothetical protein TH66_14910 [Carbonactinospora thermoautotrophica]|uniref:Uncharacterized protein n=1 Tax=Carbonactinospora thermoautotrophica TaxID=1469144 RepID=A0A132MS06_9ACTN|nr:hypothetical protein [Carbonactinospora thermoautotrophica]KWX00182.1 hypothetical protein TH66_14910 [Carbonactinospora thermoautotrophica]KWX09010.1 hypothetical protein TR74_12170 [Carbonactinospora thermoautotrophica]
MTERLAQRLRLALEILARHPDGLPQQELWRHVIERLPLDEDEQRPISTGTPYGRHAFTMSTVELVKAGWLHKERGVWHATGVGRKALADHPDPKDFFSAKNAAYQSWNRNRDKFSRAERLVEGISEGQWVAVTDVAAITGLDPDRLVAYLQGTRPEGWHRVLDPDGSPPNAAHLSEHERQRWCRLLENEDVTVFLGRADPMRRVDPEDLRQLAAEEPGEEPAGPRAWLVRGSSVHGYNLVPDWLKKGYCSLSAARLRELPAATAAVLATSGIVKVTPGSRSGL